MKYRRRGRYEKIEQKQLSYPYLKRKTMESIVTISKVYEAILENKLRNTIEGSVMEKAQSGFKKGYSTQDHVFT